MPPEAYSHEVRRCLQLRVVPNSKLRAACAPKILRRYSLLLLGVTTVATLRSAPFSGSIGDRLTPCILKQAAQQSHKNWQPQPALLLLGPRFCTSDMDTKRQEDRRNIGEAQKKSIALASLHEP